MTRITALCLLLLTTSLHHDVMGFAVRKRHSRSTDLADALRMLERQRSRLDKEQNLLNGRGLTMRDVEPWLNAAAARVPPAEDDERAAWLARAVGLDVDDDRGFDDVIPAGFPIPLRDLPRHPPAAAAAGLPVEVEPTDRELDALFGEKKEEDDQRKREKKIPMDMEKKDKERMTALTGDFGPKPKTQEDSLKSSRDEALAAQAEDLTRDEFRALLKAVEKLQKQALLTAAKEDMEEEQVAEEVEEKLEEARKESQTDEAKAVEAVAREAAKEAVQEAVKEAEIVKEVVKEAEEAKEAIKEAEALTPKPQPVSKAELESLFEDQKDEVKEVIHTGNGEIVKTKETLRDSAGRPVGQEEKVEQVEVLPDKGGALSTMEDIWYLRNYLSQDQEGERKKRNSKRSNPFPPSADRVVTPGVAVSAKAGELLQAQVAKINQLQSELDQARLVAYLEDLENDILTDALNEATIAQVKGHINPRELLSLQDAIRVEEALQQVKVNRNDAADLAQDLSQEIADQFGTQKRGEPWRKKDDVTQSEVPIVLVGDDDNDDDPDAGDAQGEEGDVRGEEGDDDEEEEQREEKESRALAMGRLLHMNPKERMALEQLLRAAPLAMRFRVASSDDDLIGESEARPIASLFTKNANQCPAVREFSSNCEFAGESIDYEAKALCNMHEMCYVCGQTLEVAQGQCDFIYRAAVTMLCQGEEDCMLESEVFLNSMKLKHRYVPYTQKICRSKCAAQFLSII